MDKKFVRLARSFVVIVLFSSGLLVPAEKDENYYDFIGIDREELQRNADSAIDNDPEYKAMAAKMGRGEVTPADLQPISAKIRNKLIAPQIKDACEAKRKKLTKEKEKAQKALEEAEDLERDEKLKALLEIEKKDRFLKTVCDTLFDSKKRAAYDTKLAISPDLASIQANIEAASYQLPSQTVLLNQIIGEYISQFEIPGPAAKVFNQDLALKGIRFLPMPSGSDVKYGLGFTGIMALNSFEVQASIYIIQDTYGRFRGSFSVDLPQSYKVSALFPQLTYLDAFKFPRAKFIIATFDGSDSDGFYFKEGFNFVAQIDLEGPFKILSDLKDKSTYLKSLVFESKPIELQGVIPPNVLKANFKAIVPMRIGVDLRKINAIPKTVSDVINRITTDDFDLTIGPVKAEKGKEGKARTFTFRKVEEDYLYGALKAKDLGYLEDVEESTGPKKIVSEIATIPLGYRIKMETGARIELGTQSAPIRLGMLGEIIPVSKGHPAGLLTVSGVMKNMLELKWLALGDAAVTFDFDGELIAAAAALGIPFTGFGLRGKIDLGKQGDARVALDAAGGFRVKGGAEIPDLVFKISAENIRLANMVEYATQLATKAKILKKPLNLADIPTMTLHHISGYCSLADTTIGGKKYSAGLGLQVETEFFDRKAGIKIFMDDKYKLSGWAYLPHINWTVKGVEVFRLTGLTPDKGPRFDMSFDPATLARGDLSKTHFEVKGIVEIPALTLKQKVDFGWRAGTLNADFETKFNDFSVLFGIKMNTKEGTISVSSLDEQVEEIKKLYQAADKINPDVIAAKKTLDDIYQFLQLKEYDRIQDILDNAKKVMEKYPESFLGPEELETNSTTGLVAQIQALTEETTYLLQAMEQKGLPVNTIKLHWQRVLTEYQTPNKSPRLLHYVFKTLQLLKQEMREALGKELKETEKVEKELAKEEKKRAPSPLLKPIEGLQQYIAEGPEDTNPFLLRKKEKVVSTTKKWEKLIVKFGFKGDFGAFLNKYAVQNLQKMRDNALKKLDQINEQIASFAFKSSEITQQEIERTKAEIAKLQQNVTDMQRACSSLPIYKQAGCRAQILSNQAKIGSKQAYLNLLLKPGKHVVTKTTGTAAATSKSITQSSRVRSATEGVLAVATAGMEMIAKGLSLINVTEVRGEYSWDDMVSFKLPKLKVLRARIELPQEMMPPMDIVLEDLQFDFKKPKESAFIISQRILMSVVEAQENKYIRYAMKALE